MRALEIRVTKLEHTVEERKKNHDANARAFATITEDYNKLQDENEQLKEALNLIKIEQAVHTSALQEVSEIKKDFKAFAAKVVEELTAIKINLSNSAVRDSTVVSVVKILVQLLGIGFTVAASIIGVLQYLQLI